MYQIINIDVNIIYSQVCHWNSWLMYKGKRQRTQSYLLSFFKRNTSCVTMFGISPSKAEKQGINSNNSVCLMAQNKGLIHKQKTGLLSKCLFKYKQQLLLFLLSPIM